MLHAVTLTCAMYVLYCALCMLSTLMMDGGMGGVIYCDIGSGFLEGELFWHGLKIPTSPSWYGDVIVTKGHEFPNCRPLRGKVHATADWRRIKLGMMYVSPESNYHTPLCPSDSQSEVKLSGYLVWTLIPVHIPFTSTFLHDGRLDQIEMLPVNTTEDTAHLACINHTLTEAPYPGQYLSTSHRDDGPPPPP